MILVAAAICVLAAAAGIWQKHTDPAPECKCEWLGQPVIPEGDLAGLVVHRADCRWLEWDRSFGGCQGDV